MGKYFLLGFSLTLAVAALATNAAFERARGKLEATAPPRDYLMPVSERTRAFVDVGARSAEVAKASRRFWATNFLGVLGKDGSIGIALKALESPGLFAEMFPGYEAARTDKALWSRYFSRNFDFDTLLPALNEGGRAPVGTYLSWLGCLDVYKRHGADYVIMGTSETYRDLVPAIIARAVSGPAADLGTGRRVLPCAAGAMTLDEARFTAENLKGRGDRPRWILWGFSFWSVFENYLPEGPRQESMNRLAFEAPFELPQLFPKLSWNRLFPPSYKALIEGKNNASHFQRSRGAVAELGEYVVPASIAGSPESVDRLAQGFHAHRGALAEITEKDCDLTRAEGRVRRALDAMLLAADRVLVYIPPTTPLHYEAAPPCLLPAVRRMLEGFSSPRVKVVTDDWRAYGLSYADFLYASMNPDYLLIDENHTSFSGARKVSERLAARLRGGETGAAL